METVRRMKKEERYQKSKDEEGQREEMAARMTERRYTKQRMKGKKDE